MQRVEVFSDLAAFEGVLGTGFSGEGLGFEVLVVDSVDDAMAWAGLDVRSEIRLVGSTGLSWLDLRERAAGERLRGTVQLDGETRIAVTEGVDAFLRAELGESTAPPFFNDMHGDLVNLILARLSASSALTFFEALAAVYLAGGWPCGWDGEYPDGRLVVFDPAGTKS